MAYTFGASDILAALGLTLNDWEVQDDDVTDTQKEAQVRGNKGAVLLRTQYDFQREFTVNLVCKSILTAAAVDVILGKEYTQIDAFGKFTLLNFRLSQKFNDECSLSLGGHVHLNSTAAHIARLFTVSLPRCGYGIAAIQSLAAVPASANTAEFSAAVQEHFDKLDRSGAFLIGGSPLVKLEETVEYADGDAITVSDGWLTDRKGMPEKNTDHVRRTITNSKFIDADA